MRTITPRIAVVGSNGYLGSRLTNALLQRPEIELILGVGRRVSGHITDQRFCYWNGGPSSQALSDHGIGALVYLAFISRPTYDEQEAFRTNVLATTMWLRAAGEAHVPHVILISSVAVYGPGARVEPVRESDLLHPNGFQFSSHKAIQERVALQQAALLGFSLTVLRPCTVVGPGVSNFVLDSLRRAPCVPIPAGANPGWQFLHEHDFCAAIMLTLCQPAAATYNVVPDDSVPLRDAIRLLGSRPISVPGRWLSVVASVGWRLGLRNFVPVPPSALPFLVGPPVASNETIRRRLNFCCRYNSIEAVKTVREAVN